MREKRLAELTPPLPREQVSRNFQTRIMELNSVIAKLNRQIMNMDNSFEALSKAELKFLRNKVAHYEHMLYVNEYLYRKLNVQ